MNIYIEKEKQKRLRNKPNQMTLRKILITTHMVTVII